MIKHNYRKYLIIVGILLICTMSFLFIRGNMVSANPTEWYEDYTYILDTTERTITLIKYNNTTETAIEVDGTVEIDGVTYDVVLDGAVYQFKDNLETITINTGVKAGTSCCNMFEYCTGLTSLDLSNLDTSEVTNMGNMFNGCSNLTTLVLTGVDTSNVTSMSWMFDNCKSLTSLNLSGFDTSLVTDMRGMFYHCKDLATLNTSYLVTSNVTDMEDMFHGCSSLTSLDFSSFDTSNVESMASMFRDCESLTSLNLSYFVTTYVRDMNSMFYNCENLATVDVTSFDTSNVENMRAMFYGCTNLTNLDVSGFTVGYVEDMSYMFSGCESLTSLVIDNFQPEYVYNLSHMFENCSSLTSLNLRDWYTYSVNNTSYMFYGCSDLTSLDVYTLYTYDVDDMRYMFANCTSLETLDLTNFETYNARYMTGMFSGCSRLSTLSLGSNFSFYGAQGEIQNTYLNNGSNNLGWANTSDYIFDVSSTNSGNYIPSYTDDTYVWAIGRLAGNVTINDLGSNTLKAVVENPDGAALTYQWFSNTSANTYGGSPISGATTDTLTVDSTLIGKYIYVEVRAVKDNFYDAKWVDIVDTWYMDYTHSFDEGNNTITLTKYNNTTAAVITVKSTVKTNGKTYAVILQGSVYRDKENLTSITIKDGVKAGISCQSMFYNCSNLTSLTFEDFDTSNVTAMSGMFFSCSSLSSLDLSSFDTSNVQDMQSMFNRCSSLSSLEIDNFDTSNVTAMRAIFYDCESLTSLNLDSFNTSKVTDMTSMFASCTNLETIDLSNFDTSRVTEMTYMFSDCSSLTSLDLSSFDTSLVTQLSYMFSNCTNLTYIDVSSFDTSNARMTYMFSNSNNISTLVLGSDFSFNGCESTMQNTGLNNGYNSQGWKNTSNEIFDVSTIESTTYIPNNVADTYTWYLLPVSGSVTLEESGTKILTANVTNPDNANLSYKWYSNNVNSTSGGTAISGANTQTISLSDSLIGKYIYVEVIASKDHYENSVWKDIVDTWYMDYTHSFDETNRKITLTQYNNTTATDIFVNGTVHTNGKTYDVILNGAVYADKTNLTDITINPEVITGADCNEMFSNCSSLTALDVVYLDTSNATSMVSMFEGCSSLANVDLTNLDTSNVEDMSMMFRDCASLTTLNLSNFNTSSVTNMENMFNGASNLSSLTLGADFALDSGAGLNNGNNTHVGWKNTAGNHYTPSSIPANVADTYVWDDDYVVTFNYNFGSTPSTTQTFNYGVAANLNNNPIARLGYTFSGWSDDPNAISATYTDGQSVTNVNNIQNLTTDTTTLYGVWQSNNLILNDVTKTFTYTTGPQRFTISEATNGSGSYTYSEVSEKDANNVDTNYFSISGTTITVEAGIPVGTYTCTVRATDDVTELTDDATITVTVNGATIVLGIENDDDLNKTEDYTGEPISPNTVTVTTPESGAVVKYGTVEGTYDLDNPQSYTNAGTYTIYYQITADNYETKTGSYTLTINKVDPTHDIGESNSLTYTGNPQTLGIITTDGGAVTYSDTEDGEYTANSPMQTNAGTYTTYYKIAGDENHNAYSGSFETIIAKKEVTITVEDQTVTYPDAKTYTFESDGDGTFTVTSSNTDIITVSIEGKTITITPVAENTTPVTITVTHTAVDGGNIQSGNKTFTVTVEGQATVQTVIESEKYDVDDFAIKRIQPNTLKTLFDSNIEVNKNYVVKNKEGEIITDEDFITTGSKLVCDDGTEKVLIVIGDVDEDGDADITDIFEMNKYRLEMTEFSEITMLAADIDEDEDADIDDIYEVNKYRLGIIEEL